MAPNAAAAQVGTVSAVAHTNPDSAARTLRDLHGEAEAGIERAIGATRAAAEVAAGVNPPMRDAFEYQEALRDLRAARTALRSALIDVDRQSEAQAESM